VKTTQKSRLHRIAYAARAIENGPRPPRLKPYRQDGWPLCPSCGEDELASTAPFAIGRQPQSSDPMRCVACGWTGTVAAHEAK